MNMLSLRLRLRRFIYRISEYNLTLYIISVVVGIWGGLGAVIFRLLINLNNIVFLGNIAQYSIIISPALGALIAGILINKFAHEAKGHGVPEVIYAVWERFGIIRKRVAVVKILASSVIIGSGGSAGREGPIAQIGASIASSLGQLMRLKANELRLLVSAGLVAGISGTFNAPLGALIFGIEILSPTLDVTRLISLVLASVSGKIVATIFLGDFPAFIVPQGITLSNLQELEFIIVMGLVMGAIAGLWVKAFYWMEELFEKWNIPDIVKPMLGGLMVGLLALEWSDLGVLGVGYDVIERYLLYRDLLAIDLLIAGLIKMIATIYTIGSGGSGGIFAPSLVIGSSIGGAMGEILSVMFPGLVGDPRAYSIIGMAIFFTAVAKAPLTTLIMIPEMTRTYELFLPIMVGNSVAYIMSLLILGRYSIYTLKVRKIKRRPI